jgi:putative lipoprotein
MSMNKITSVLAIGLVIAACSDPEPTVVEPEKQSATVAGTVVFREMIGLTPASQLQVELIDVSLTDKAAPVIATSTIDNPGQSPIAFSIEYDPELINQGHSYSIRAKVLDRDHLILQSDSISPAITLNAPTATTVFAVRVSQNKLDQPDASIADTKWMLSTVSGRQVPRRERGRDIQITFDSKISGVSGFGGCNQFRGGYQIDGNKLDIGDLVVTEMACQTGGDSETLFLKALAELQEVRVEGRTMRGYKQGALVISFESDPVR